MGYRVENVAPMLRVDDMAASLRFYVELLGFSAAPWGSDEFTLLERGGGMIYLCRGDQGRGGAWVWIGVDDVVPLHEALVARGVTIKLPPTRYPYAVEMQVEDPSGNVLRFGSDPD